MDSVKLAEIKLSCLQEAAKQCLLSPTETLKVAKELYEWVIAIN